MSLEQRNPTVGEYPELGSMARRLPGLDEKSIAVTRAIVCLEELVLDHSHNHFGEEVTEFLTNYVLNVVSKNVLVARQRWAIFNIYQSNEPIRDFIDILDFNLFARLNFTTHRYTNLLEALATGLSTTEISDYRVNKDTDKLSAELLSRRVSYDEVMSILSSNRWLVLYFLITMVRPSIIRRFIKAQKDRLRSASESVKR